jgi:hypothetical protein
MTASREAMDIRNRHGRRFLRREIWRILKLAWNDTITHPRNIKKCQKHGHIFDDKYRAVCSRCYAHMADVDPEAWEKRLAQWDKQPGISEG